MIYDRVNKMNVSIKGNLSYDILVVDSSGKMFEFDRNGNVISEIPTRGAAFEIWKIGGNYLYPHLGNKGISLVDKTGDVIKTYVSESEIFTCQPLDNGGAVVGELTQKRIVELDSEFKISKIIPVKSEISGHEVMRMARKLKDGTYLVVHPGDCAIRQYDMDGNVVLEIPTYKNTFAAHLLDDGNVVYTSQTAVVIADRTGNTVWKADSEDLEETAPQWLTGLEILDNGNFLVCNWLGHNREGMGAPLFEIDRNKNIIWSLRAPEILKNSANIKAL